MTRPFIYVGLSVVLGICSQVVTQPSSEQQSESVLSTLDLLNSADLRTRVEAGNRLVKDREVQIRRLIEIASSQDSAEFDTPAKRYVSPKCLAIFLLGKFRADDDASRKALWDNLAYEIEPVTGTLNQLFDPGSRYPAAASLVRIGKPACERAWFELQTTSDPVRRDLAIYILERVEGRELARRLVEDRLQKQAGTPDVLSNATPEKKNLERAREWIVERSKDAGSGGKPPTVGDPK